jgi:glycosyltransferase involved in cell wall biosynthesis
MTRLEHRAKVSIVMPTLNQVDYLRSAIDSVITQEGELDVECIVVDGGSTDGTLGILRSYGRTITWVSGRDGGQSDGLNKGLHMATGNVLGWLNSDDLYEPGALRRVVHALTVQPSAEWVYGRVRIVDEHGHEIRRAVTAYKNWRLRRLRYRRLLVENSISQMGVFWRRSAWERAGDFRTDLHLAMDYDYWLRLARVSPGLHIPEYLGAFRWYRSSKSGSRFKEQFAEELRVAREHAGGDYSLEMLLHRVYVARTVGVYSLLQRMRR